MRKRLLAALVASWPALSAAAPLPEADQAFLEMIARRTFDWFWEEAKPSNGLIPDATRNRNCSITVVGFGLAGLCIAAERGWITRRQAYDRALVTLKSFGAVPGPDGTRVEEERGHHYHWVNMDTGAWIREEGIFASDTMVLVAGVVTVGQYFAGTEVQRLAEEIYRRVDWTWFMNPKTRGIHIGWTPSTGFGGEYAKGEVGTLFALLGIGSPTYPLPVDTWFVLGNSYYRAEYKGYSYIGDGAAYTHQWPFCFIDPRLKKDPYVDYAHNLREFALAARRWCADRPEEGYSENIWGLTPSVGPGKYGEYAAPVIPGAPLGYNGRDNDGTVAPTAALGLVPFAPEEVVAAARHMHDRFGDKIFGRYGFTDSFNVLKGFYADEYLGIDQGPILLMIDNLLYGTVWKAFMSSPHVQRAMALVGFAGVVDDFDESAHNPPYAAWTASAGVSAARVNAGRRGRALRARAPAAGGAVAAAPLLRDFSGRKALTFWSRGAGPVAVTVEGADGNAVPLKAGRTIREGDWTFHRLLLGAAPREARRVRFALPAGETVLDEVLLSDAPDAPPPPAPRLFAETGAQGGEIAVSWRLAASSGPAVPRGELRLSERPIRTWADFDAARPAVPGFAPAGYPAAQTVTVGDLTPGETYHLAMAVMDVRGVRSALATASAAANARPVQAFALSAPGTEALDPASWKPIASPGDRCVLRKGPGGALRVAYDMVSGVHNYHWFGAGRPVRGRLRKGARFTFRVKGTSEEPLNLEFKVVDASGAVFGKKVENFRFTGGWQDVSVSRGELVYMWGGEGPSTLSSADALEIVFSTPLSVEGKVWISDLKAEAP